MAATSTRVPVPLATHSNEAPSEAEGVERLVNAYLETTPNGKEPTPVYGTPGFVSYCTLGENVRGMINVDGLLYVVSGDNLSSVDANGVVTELTSAMVPEEGGVTLASDGLNIVIANSGTIWVHDIAAGTTTEVTDPDAPDSSTVDYLDGYFIFGVDGTGEFAICALQDPTNFDALDFATAEWKPDRLIRPIVRGRTLLLLGSQSIEGQTNVGDTAFPFARTQDLFIDVGVAGRDAAVISNESLFFLASDGTCRRLDGATATRISTFSIERIIADWSEPQNTIVTAHVWRGHLFIVFRNGEGCIVFDQSTQMWHERVSGTFPSWQYIYNADCYGKRLFSRENSIYAMDADAFSDIDVAIITEITTPYLSAAGRRFSANELELIMDTGGDGSGTVSVAATRDGVTWSAERAKTFTEPLSETARLRFGRYAQQRAIAWRLTLTGNSRRAVLGLYADIEVDET